MTNKNTNANTIIINIPQSKPVKRSRSPNKQNSNNTNQLVNTSTLQGEVLRESLNNIRNPVFRNNEVAEKIKVMEKPMGINVSTDTFDVPVENPDEFVKRGNNTNPYEEQEDQVENPVTNETPNYLVQQPENNYETPKQKNINFNEDNTNDDDVEEYVTLIPNLRNRLLKRYGKMKKKELRDLANEYRINTNTKKKKELIEKIIEYDMSFI